MSKHAIFQPKRVSDFVITFTTVDFSLKKCYTAVGKQYRKTLYPLHRTKSSNLQDVFFNTGRIAITLKWYWYSTSPVASSMSMLLSEAIFVSYSDSGQIRLRLCVQMFKHCKSLTIDTKNSNTFEYGLCGFYSTESDRVKSCHKSTKSILFS